MDVGVARSIRVLVSSSEDSKTRPLADEFLANACFDVVGLADSDAQIVDLAAALRPDVVILEMGPGVTKNAAALRSLDPNMVMLILGTGEDELAQRRALSLRAAAFVSYTETPGSILEVVVALASLGVCD